MVVVLPAPFGPRKACTSPARTVRSRPSSAVAAPNRLRSPAASITFVMPPQFLRPSVATMRALIVCIRFSACSKTTEAGDSKTSSVTSRASRRRWP